MVAIVTVLLVITLSLVVTKIASIILTFTGISRDAARFQARSAFTGTGFTTSEAEMVIDHPVRRRVVMLLMLLGNAGLITIIASLMTSMVGIDAEMRERERQSVPIRVVPNDGQAAEYTLEIGPRPDDPRELTWEEYIFGRSPTVRFISRMAILILGIALLWAVASSQWVDKQLRRFTVWALQRWTDLERYDFHSLLHLGEGFKISEFPVTEGSWLVGKTLAETRLAEEGIQVLGFIRSDGKYVGTPTGATYIRKGDRMIVHGQADVIRDLETRLEGPLGDFAHAARVVEQEEQRGEIDNGERPDERDDEFPAG